MNITILIYPCTDPLISIFTYLSENTRDGGKKDSENQKINEDMQKLINRQ